MSKKGQRLCVGVFMGGETVEREVSFNSGRTVCDHLDTRRFDIIPIFQKSTGELYLLPWRFLHRGKITDFEHRLETQAERIVWDDLKDLVDFIFLAVHGRFAEDGTLQGMLEVLRIPYLGAKVFAAAASMDKIFHNEFLRSHGITVPRGIAVYPKQVKKTNIKTICAQLKKQNIFFPYVVKPAYEGSSMGISVVHTEKELFPALYKAAFEQVTHEQPVLIEEKINGMEFNCIPLQKSARIALQIKCSSDWVTPPITEVVLESGADFYDYEQKYMPGRAMKITPARCSADAMKKIQNTCEQVSTILELETFARVDGFLTKDGDVVIVDTNPLSGMAPASFVFHQAAEIGLNHTQLINYLISLELEKRGIEIKEEKNMVEKSEKKRVVVLLGGDSNEREISLESGRNVCYKLSPSKYEVIPVFVNQQMELFRLTPRLLIQNSAREIAAMITPDFQIKWADLPAFCDFVFIGLHGGDGENGSVQGALEKLGLPYNGSGVLASSLCMDKYKTNQYLKTKDFHVPDAQLVTRVEWEQKRAGLIDKIGKHFSFPLIVKPHDDGCSFYVRKVKNTEELSVILDEYFKAEKNTAMVEECVSGMELTVGVLGNDLVQALPPSRAVALDDILSIQEKFLPGAGENQTPAPLPEKTLLDIQEEVARVYTTLGCAGYSRIDCFYQEGKGNKKGKVVMLEVNTLPGLTPATCIFHQAAEVGMKPMEFIDRIVDLGFEQHSYHRTKDVSRAIRSQNT